MAPGYIALLECGELAERISRARATMSRCTICPQHCGVDRNAGDLGVCGIGSLAPVASYGPHFGEEGPLVGNGGSGTIFFASCNLLCSFCQNYEISHCRETDTHQLEPGQLAAVMLDLQEQGCHNINLVTPSHVVCQILEALPEAIDRGLRLPLVYNSNGYDSPASLALLDGIVDIYMPDFKFWHSETAAAYTRADDYPAVARKALKAMFAQVGDLRLDSNGIAERGLLVRHLVMPGHVDEAGEILGFLAREISPTCHVNIMDQYRPCGQAPPPIDRPLSPEEYRQALAFAGPTGLVQLNEDRLADLLRRLGIL